LKLLFGVKISSIIVHHHVEMGFLNSTKEGDEYYKIH